MGYSDFSEGYRKELNDLRSRLQELLLAEWKCKMEGRVKPDTTSQRELTLYRRQYEWNTFYLCEGTFSPEETYYSGVLLPCPPDATDGLDHIKCNSKDLFDLPPEHKDPDGDFMVDDYVVKVTNIRPRLSDESIKGGVANM